MKRKILLFICFILSLSIGFGIGIVAFSTENIKNSIDGLVDKDFSDGTINTEQIGQLQYFTVSLDDEIYVKNLLFNGNIHDNLDSVRVYYTDNANKEFNAQNSFFPKITIKNDNYYLEIDKNVTAIRLELLPSDTVENIKVNPKILNIHTVNTILFTILPLVISFSAVSLIFDRESLKKDILAIKRYKYLLYELVLKDIKTKYRRSVLGLLWSVLNPLLMMIVLTAVFSNIIRVEVEGGFALFYLTGYLLFNFISESTNFSLNTILQAAQLIKKVYIPKYIFPLQKCLFSFVNMIFSLTAFVIVFTIFMIWGNVSLNFSMLLFPIPLILIFLFSLGCCFILSSLVVFFRDIGHIWGILLTVWMYASPIIYPISILPDWLVSAIKLNPLYYYIDMFRNIMIYGRIPAFADFIIALLFSVASVLVGTVIFRKCQDKFVMYI